MFAALQALRQHLTHAHGVLVTVQQVQGSGPREEGAWMAVFADTTINTLGGGHLEYQAIAEARALLSRQASPALADAPSAAPHHADEVLVLRYPLGPALGQCCGGVVHLRYDPIGPADLQDLLQRLRPQVQPLALFGGGHVGHALIELLARLPFDVAWFDSREGIFPQVLPMNVQAEHSHPVHAAVQHLPAGSAVLIMSFSHAEDLDIVAACLKRIRLQDDLPFVGLIGSKTKWATFRHRLEARGFTAAELDRITCPIGVAGIPGKAPEVVAIAVAAQLLQISPQSAK